MNKEVEIFFLSKFRENFAHFPRGAICPDERPDFLVKTRSGIVGIELTRFYREMSSSAHHTLQQKGSTRQRIVNLANSMCNELGVPPLHVIVHFDLSFYCASREIPSFAERLVQLAKCSLSDQTNRKVWGRDDIQLKGVSWVNVNRTTVRNGYWSAPMPNFVPEVTSDQLQHILDQKSPCCEDYRRKCDKVWLVIIMNRFEPASFSSIPQTTLEHLYAHKFDSAFLFCYDFPNAQKPPFLLRNPQSIQSRPF